MMAAKHSTGVCPRGRGMKGRACSRVSSLGPAQGLGSICRDEPCARQDGEGWLRSAELRAQGGRGGRPPSAGSTADLWDAEAGCTDGVTCPFEKMPVWEFASGRAVQAELFLFAAPTLCTPDTARELLVPAELSQGQRQWEHLPQVGTAQPGCVSLGFACKAVLGAGAHARAHTHTHTHSAAFESHQLTLKLGLIFINLPRLSFSAIWCHPAWMDTGKPAHMDRHALWGYVSPSSPPGKGRIAGERREGDSLETFIALVGPRETSLKHTQSLRTHVGGCTAPCSNATGMQHVLHCVKWSRMRREEWL